jgi:hypothetical protein
MISIYNCLFAALAAQHPKIYPEELCCAVRGDDTG